MLFSDVIIEGGPEFRNPFFRTSVFGKEEPLATQRALVDKWRALLPTRHDKLWFLIRHGLDCALPFNTLDLETGSCFLAAERIPHVPEGYRTDDFAAPQFGRRD
jgi:hypothetical protein